MHLVKMNQRGTEMSQNCLLEKVNSFQETTIFSMKMTLMHSIVVINIIAFLTPTPVFCVQSKMKILVLQSSPWKSEATPSLHFLPSLCSLKNICQYVLV